MKLNAAFVAVALAASKVHGLPIADSGINVIAARSDVKLDGGVTLQAAKRGTDTDLLIRQLAHADAAQQVLLIRGTGELTDGTLAQHDVLIERDITGTAKGAVEATTDVVAELGAGALPKTSLEEKVVTKSPINYAELNKLRKQIGPDEATYYTLNEAVHGDPAYLHFPNDVKEHLSKALAKHKALYHVNHAKLIRAGGKEPDTDILKGEREGKAVLDSIKPPVTIEELAKQREHDEVVEKAFEARHRKISERFDELRRQPWTQPTLNEHGKTFLEAYSQALDRLTWSSREEMFANTPKVHDNLA